MQRNIGERFIPSMFQRKSRDWMGPEKAEKRINSVVGDLVYRELQRLCVAKKEDTAMIFH